MVLLNKHRLADWSKAPEWATHHAVDKNGEGCWYGPIMGIFENEDEFSVLYNDIMPGSDYDLSNINWRETLESRPDTELDRLREENARLHERINRLTLDRINSEERHDPI